jgi:prophage regulatory protein
MSSTTNQGVNRPISPLLRIEEVAQLLGCSTRHVSNLYREGRMPPRIAISERLVGWRESDLEAWLTSRREESSND